MRKAEDLIGQVFGKLTVIERAENNRHNAIQWVCECKCGNKTIYTTSNLKSGNYVSCGCNKRRNFVGGTFERLTVIEIAYIKNHRKYLKCKCKCGNEVVISSSAWGHTQSCGCITKERLTIHGLRFTRLHTVWMSMKNRCYNRNGRAYNDYGGRGIEVCDEWRNDFQAFYEWAMSNGYDENAPSGECTIDRIDVNGNYEPSNCRWVNMKAQANNTRRNRFLNYNGERLTIAQPADKYCINRGTLWSRLKNGMSDKEAIEEPIGRWKHICLKAR